MKKAARILIVEDIATDAELAEREIRKIFRDCTFQVVETRNDFLQALEIFQPDAILSDYTLPRFDGMTALKLARKHAPFTPLIIWTGANGEDIAVDCLKAGANNYVLKDNVKRLGPAVLRALEEREILLGRKQAEEKYQAIFENSVIGIFQSTPQGRYRIVNPAMARIYGYDSPTEMIEAITDIKQQIYVDPHRRVEYVKLMDLQGTVEHFEERNYRKDGRIIWTSTSARAVRDPNGNILYYEGFITDVTARREIEEQLKERERQLRILFGNLPGPVYRCRNDASYTMDFVSDGIEELSGYPAEDFQEQRRDYGKLIHTEDRESVWTAIQAAVQCNQPFEVTYRLISASGEEKWVWEKGQGVYDERGQLQALEGFITDITARQRAEEAIQNSEKRFRALIENGLDNISLLAENGTLLWESPATIRMLSYEPDEFVGHNIFELMHPADFEWTRDLYARLLQEPGSRQSGIFRLRHSDGTWRWVEAIVTNMLNEPSVNAMVVNYRDITERKLAEQALAESQSKYQNLVETSHDLIWSVDAAGQITFLNRAAKEIYGYEPEELIGRPYAEIMDQGSDNPLKFETIKEMIGEGTEFTGVESRVRHRNGRVIILSANFIVHRDQNGNLTGITGTSRDVTAQKQVEEVLKEERNLLRTLIDNIPDRIYAMDNQGRKTLSNTADWRACGGKTMEDIIGKTDFDTYPPDLAEEFWQLDKVVLESGQAIINYEEPGLDAEGNRVSILTTKIPLRDEEGNVTGLVGVGRDITERKQVEARINDLLAFNEKILNHSGVGILTYKLSGQCVFANEKAASIVGTTMARLLSQNFRAIEAWKKSGLHHLVEEAIATQTPVTADIHHLSTFGKDIWMTIHCITFKLKGEDHLLLSISEITERKETEEKLRSSEDRYRLATRATNDVIWESNLQTKQLFWSENAQFVFGYSPEEVNSHETWWEDHLHPDDYERVLLKINSLIEGEESLWLEEYRFLLKDRSYAYISDRGYIERDVNGTPLRMIGAMTNITERKQAETERQALLEITQGLANTEDLNELLRLIHRSIARVIYAKNFFVVLYQPDTGLFEEIYSVDQYDPPEPPAKLENSITSYVFRSGEPLLLTQILFDELVRQGEMKLIGTNSASWLGVPLKTSGRTIGVMAVQDYEIDNRYTERDKDFLASIAAQVALVIERKQADIQLQQKNDDLGLLNAINEAVVQGESLDSIVELLAKELSRIFSVQGSTIYSTIYMLDPEKQSIRMQKYFFSAETERRIEKLIGLRLPNIEMPIKAGSHFHQAMLSRRSALKAEPKAIQSWIGEFTETSFLHPLARIAIRKLVPQIHKILNIQSVITIPLISEEETIGFWDVSSSGLFTAADQKRIEHIGGQLTAVIQRQQANEKIRRSEEFLQGVQNALSASIAILNENGTIIQVNSAWRGFGKQNGLAHSNACIGVNYLEICDSATGSNAQEAASVAQAIRAIIAGERSEARIEYPCHGPDVQRWFTLYITKFEDGDHIWIVLAHEDISERKRVEQSLTLFRTQMDHINDAIEVVDPETRRYIDVNERACRMRGYTREEYLTLTVDDIDPLVSTLAWHTGNEFSHSGSVVFESINRRKDGSSFPVEVNLNLIQLDREYSLAVVRDITERKQAEEALRESEEHYRAIFEGVQDAIFVESLDGRILMVNERACEMFGYSQAEFVTKTVKDLVPEGHLILRADGENSLLSREPRETFNKRANGEIFPIDISGRLQVINGEKVLLVVVRDITERKRAEEALRASNERFSIVSKAVNEVVWDWNLVTNHVDWNDAIYTLFKYSPDRVGTDANWWMENLHPDDREQIISSVHNLIDSGITNYWKSEYRYRMADGSYAFIFDRGYIIRDASGKALRMIGAMQNITERKEAEEALHKSEALYRRAIEVAGAVPYYETYYDQGRSIKYEFIGEGIRQITGYGPGEFNATLWDSLVEEINLVGDLAGYSLEDAIQRVRAGENSIWKCEHRLRDRDGNIHWVFEAAVELRDEQGVSYGSIGTYQDITERKLAEEALREAETKYRTLVEQLPAVTYLDVIDSSINAGEFNTSYISPQVEDLLGYPPHAFLTDRSLWASLVHPEDRDRVLTKIAEYYKNTGFYNDEYRMLTRQGHEVWVRDEAIMVSAGGDKRPFSQGVIFDITERKRAETALMESTAKFRTLFEASPDAIMLIDQCDDWPIVDCNTAACRMNGYSREELIGQSIDILNVQPSAPEGRAAYLAEIHKADVYRLEAAHRRKDGTVFPVDISTSLITLGGRELVLGIDRDITERKQMEAAEREQRTLAEALRDTAEMLSSTLDYGEVLDHILAAVGRVVPHDAATIMLLDGEYAHVVRSHGYDKNNYAVEIMGLRLPLAETINLRQMFETRQPVVVSDTHVYPGWKRMPAIDWLRSNVGAPISIYGKTIGFICLDSQAPEFFTPVHAERLEAFANQAALAIHNARLLQQAQEEIAERKRAEEELRFEKERLEKIAAAVPGLIGSLRLRPDGSGCMPFASPAAQDVYGFLPSELKEDVAPFFSRVHPEDLPHLHASIQESARDLLPWHGEFRYNHPTKGEVWIEGRSMPLREEDGSTIWHGFIYDITERKQADEELRASEERFRQLADNIQEVFWMTDAESGKEIYLSPAAEAIWGVPLETLMFEPYAFIKSVFSEDLPTVLRNIEKEKNGEKVEMEYRIMRPDGSLRWIWDRAFPISDASGKVKRIAGISADITQRREAELALVKSQSRYRELFDSSPVSIWEEDFTLVKKRVDSLLKSGVADLRDYFSSHPEEVMELASLVMITDVNQASLDLYQTEHKEDLIKNLTQALGVEFVGHFQEEILGFLSPQQKFVWEGTEHMQDGKQMELVVTGSIPHGYEEDWSKVIVSIIDITERKQAEESLRESEERYHGLFQNLVDGFALHEIVTDDQGKPVDYVFLEVNPAFERMTGLDAQHILGRRIREVLPGVENERFIPIYGQVALTGEPIHFEEYSAPLGRHFEINAYSPKRGQFAVTFVDVTERKQAENEIRRRAEENSILLKTSLGLTHLDLKTTLQTIGDSAKNLFAADGCRIFLMEPDGKFLRCVLALQENVDAFSDLRIKLGEGVTGAVAASGQAEIVNEMHKDPRSVHIVGTPAEEEAIMFAPLKERDNTVGVLSVRRIGGDCPFQRADLELLEALASMAASAVSNARLFAETQRRLTELEALYENGLAVGRLLKPREIGNRIINTFARYLAWHHVTIRLRQDTSDNLELVAFNLPSLKEEERSNAEQHFIARINKVGQGLSGWVIQTGIPLRTGNVHAHPQYIDTHAGIQSGIYMPLKVGERVIGVISVESEVPDAFTEQDERLLATLGSQAAIAFENARLYQAIEQELSERKRAEEALRTSETHYRELADSITDILFELDQDLRYTHWNKASELLTGISAQDAIGKSMYQIFGETQEQTEIGHIYIDVLKNHRSRAFETTILLNGEKRSFDINAYPSTRGVSVVAKDVTDRKRSEVIMQKRFELMEYSAHHALDELMQRTVDEVSELTGSMIGFFHFVQEDQNTLGMQTWSTNALRLFNVPISEGTHLALDQAGVWADAVHQRRPLIQNDYEALTHKKGLPQGHVPITREIVIPIIRNEKVMAIMGIGNKTQDYTSYDLEVAERLADYAWDITERKQMQVALEMERNQLAKRVEERTSDLSQANSNLARALRVKDEFLANMSHELRTPLNAILGLSESLGEQIAGPLNEKQQKYITTISESGHHLLSLINDILDLAKIEAGQITLDISKMDLHQVCQASLRMIKQLAQKKNQDVVLEIGQEVGLMWADERRLKQMIVNLLGNAVKFTPEDGKIGLEVHGDQLANKVTITVWDNGIGIKEADLARLFQPFVQLDSGLAREATGTGLGLALVAQMARLHGGSVSAVSEPGKGSRFSIILPWEPALAIDTASRLRTTGKFRAIKPEETNKPTVLLVEDTKEVVMMIRDYLELAGYRVAVARDGVEAIAQARLVHPDLILMDVMMPRMDGFEATRKLRSEPEFKYTPIIALTALAMPSDRERCLAAGMDEYISKPVNLKALIRIIQSCLFNSKELKPE